MKSSSPVSNQDKNRIPEQFRLFWLPGSGWFLPSVATEDKEPAANVNEQFMDLLLLQIDNQRLLAECFYHVFV